jgi:hypothetical protein
LIQRNLGGRELTRWLLWLSGSAGRGGAIATHCCGDLHPRFGGLLESPRFFARPHRF